MSLRVWLPLNGTLNNQGLDDIAVTNNGATIDNSGKIGKCYSFDGTSSFLNLSPTFMANFTECSICFWLKINDWNSSYATYFQAGKNGASWADYILGILRNSSGSTICFTIGNGSSASNNSYITSARTVGEWCHMSFIYSPGKCKIYLNGILDKEYTTTFVPNFAKVTEITIGHSNGGGYQTNCLMNDFRIYDHALSPMEVKQISQGLILHYPLNNNGWGQENLATCNTIQYNLAASTGNWNYFWITSSTALEPNTIYTFSAEVEISDNYERCTIYNYTGSGKSGEINYYFPADGKRHSWTFTTTSDALGVIAYAGTAGNTANYSAIYKKIKLEKGSKATPWCPNEADELYNKLGLNENIQYDTSGYCNNGIKIGTFQYKSDTPKYDISTYAQGGASTHLEGIILPSEAKTVSLWIKCAKTVNSAIFNDRITGLQIGLLNSLLYVNSLTSTKGFTTTHWKNNEWNHVVVINDNGTRFCYVNGQAETQSGSSNYYIHNTDKFWLWNRSYNNNYSFKGNLSDLRIYCTALSLEDILLLYHNSAYIDNQGNIYGAIYEEV